MIPSLNSRRVSDMQSFDLEVGGSDDRYALLDGSDARVLQSGARHCCEDPLTCIAFNINTAFVILVIKALSAWDACEPAADSSSGAISAISTLAYFVIISSIASALTTLALSIVRNSLALLCAAIPMNLLTATLALAMTVVEPTSSEELVCDSTSFASEWTIGALGIAASSVLLIVASVNRRVRLVGLQKAALRTSSHEQTSEEKKIALFFLGVLMFIGFPAMIEVFLLELAWK